MVLQRITPFIRAPLKMAPCKSAPCRSAPCRFAPRKFTPRRCAPCRSALSKFAPWRFAPWSIASFRSALSKSAPSSGDAVRLHWKHSLVSFSCLRCCGSKLVASLLVLCSVAAIAKINNIRIVVTLNLLQSLYILTSEKLYSQGFLILFFKLSVRAPSI